MGERILKTCDCERSGKLQAGRNGPFGYNKRRNATFQSFLNCKKLSNCREDDEGRVEEEGKGEEPPAQERKGSLFVAAPEFIQELFAQRSRSNGRSYAKGFSNLTTRPHNGRNFAHFRDGHNESVTHRRDC